MSNLEPMDVDMSFLANGLQQDNESIDQLLENLDWTDLLRSPGPNSGYSNYEGFPPGVDMQNEMNDPMLAGDGAPMPPQAYAVPNSHADMDESERTDSFREIEPMRLGSTDMRETLMADPTALGESLGSIELNPSKNPSAQQSGVAMQASVAAQRYTNTLPDSSQTQGPVVTSSTAGPSSSRTSADTTTAPHKVHFGDYELPDFHSFNVSVKFLSTPILEKTIRGVGGCLLHYQPLNQEVIPVPPELERVSIPIGIRNDQDGTLGEFPWAKEKQKRFTELILRSFDFGVEFYSKDGNIYAKRKCNTKLFWHNTDGHGHAQELKRNTETEVFNWVKFQENLAKSYISGNHRNVILPAIWFSFAQKWDRPSSPITTKLVWARIDPLRACEMVKNINPDVKSTTSLESLTSSQIYVNISLESNPEINSSASL